MWSRSCASPKPWPNAANPAQTLKMRWLLLKPRAAQVVLFCLLLIGLVFAAYKLPFDPDLFWHIRAGRDILQRGIPMIDWYSHTMPNFFWINHEYAQDVFMSLIHDGIGFRGLSIVYALIVAFSMSWGVWWSMARRLPWLWSLSAGLAITLASRSFLGVRPQMFTYLLLLVLLGVLRRALTAQKSARWFILVPIVFIVWANLHASFVAGFIVLFVFLTCESVKLLTASHLKLGMVPHIKNVVRLALATLVSIPATFINAYGYNIWLEPYRTLTDKALHNNIVEWFAPEPYSHTGYMLFGGVIVFMVLLVVRQRRLDLTDAALSIGFFASSLLAVRNIPLFLLMATPLMFEGVRSLLVTPKMQSIAARSLQLWPTLLAIALFTLLGSHNFPWHTFDRLDRDPAVFAEDGYPEGAAAYLAAHPEFADAHPFNEYGWGGYLLYRVPWFKTFIDGRMPSWVEPRAEGDLKIIDKFFTIDRREDWQATVKEFGVNLFVIKADHKLVGDLRINNNYVELFKDEQTVVYASTDLAALER